MRSLFTSLAFLAIVAVAGPAFGVCGDGVVDAGEACDDGNTFTGDCCAPDCTIDAPGTLCGSDQLCESAWQGRCDASGDCSLPSACSPFSGAPLGCGFQIKIKDRSDDRSDVLSAKLLSGRGSGPLGFPIVDTPDQLPAEFGDPSQGTRVAICLDAFDSAGNRTPLYGLELLGGADWRFRRSNWQLKRKTGTGRLTARYPNLKLRGKGEVLLLPAPHSSEEYLPGPLAIDQDLHVAFVTEAGHCFFLVANGFAKLTESDVKIRRRCFLD